MAEVRCQTPAESSTRGTNQEQSPLPTVVPQQYYERKVAGQEGPHDIVGLKQVMRSDLPAVPFG